MIFCDHYEENLENLEIFHLLEEEMTKYKTLNHEKIQWDKVYEYSLDILQNNSMDMKIFAYFSLSCLALNNEECFKIFLEIIIFTEKLFREKPENISKTSSILLNQKKKYKQIVENFINEFNKNSPKCSQVTAKSLNEYFEKLREILNCNFAKLNIKEEITQTKQSPLKSPVTQVNIDIKNTKLSNLSDREYRTLLNNLAIELLENNIENTNAYSLFAEAAWGRLKTLPPHSDFVTKVRYPDRNLIKLLLDKNTNELDQIKCFINNLSLNPFWIEGFKLFCDFLHHHQKEHSLKILNLLTCNFILKFKDITKLRFDNGELMCKEDTFNYFVKQNQETNKKTHTTSDKNKKVEQLLIEINNENYNNSLFCNINSLIAMAQVFETNNMKNNAKIIYLQLVELMEKTLLKDYLSDEYNYAKNKTNKKI
ncbi:type VI secretion system domain-containing protein [Campylobacter sp. RKI_CA19_01128]|uniref:Type VI secretion system domain-containing protein n=1 Tax=Campylobacter lari TaxID=201 RepID=A0A7M1MGP2_CAMLA|nr:MULTISPECIES: TssA family type VI secretion system protein [Campylobacter]MCR6519462.1 type VI secretion system domain-containing protein [Campylobacter lari]MCV3349791.1 type VI secretion system domain-containing protein [Campylobacter sp. RKI_CA19_01127]MCV3355745.1 type VI secretion system domain-containing protein [Campylobacter sp. RKI_CA19_01128]QOR00138.1 type VI secretion system domain-containing protein [Campylobacter lari]HEC1777159.1 type VI secretion system domain-containing pro